MSTLAWARCENGWWLDSKRSPVWRISAGKLPQRETTAVIQGHLQAGSEGLRNGLQQMGKLDIWAFSLEAGGAAWPLPIWRGTCSGSRGKEAVLKPAKSGSWTGDRLYLFSLWDCHSWIGLLSHTRCCSKTSIQSMLPQSLKSEGCLPVMEGTRAICFLSSHIYCRWVLSRVPESGFFSNKFFLVTYDSKADATIPP